MRFEKLPLRQKRALGYKRLFLAFRIEAPWPQQLAKGRLIAARERHMTLAFLGEQPWPSLRDQLARLPLPPFSTGLVGRFVRSLSLPPGHNRVIAWEAEALEPRKLFLYQHRLMEWLLEEGLLSCEKAALPSWLPHVTLCRAPFDRRGWEELFAPLPFSMSELHLYESLGDLHYGPLWSHLLPRPFLVESQDDQLRIQAVGNSWSQLFAHLATAIQFVYRETNLNHKVEEALSSRGAMVDRLRQLLSSLPHIAATSFRSLPTAERELLSEELLFTLVL